MRMGPEISKDAAPKIESIQSIFEEILGVSPDVISMQEVVPAWFAAIFTKRYPRPVWRTRVTDSWMPLLP